MLFIALFKNLSFMLTAEMSLFCHLGLWWSKTSLDYFERLIRVFKNVVMFILRKTETVNQEVRNMYKFSAHLLTV